ncbi:tetratricopeptide repeat protein [Saccharothrix sp. S26]|uniref:AfsR/SARP family transcriptional regulator n=1 Tax=Saccharothrix sp. S26 TaxID=2907215 RepID=UPI001F39AE6B|nr:AfsR/SARP family transcriptional regulator [Saccharothrix sp. S26]MCE6996499.1 tetratricopeptide repeat protein [Saccharothrix sp. S26]
MDLAAVGSPPTPVYRILGPLHVADGPGRVSRVPPGRQQMVLGALLLDANRVVSIDHLIDAVWDEAPPATARRQIQICVSALRANLASIGRDEAIVTRPPGYLLRVADGELDVQVFAALTAEGESLVRSGDPKAGLVLLRQALALWRGPALGGTTGRLRAKAAKLDEDRLTVLETTFDLELNAGRHRQLVGEISALVAQYPLRERLRGQLMLALYRSGRQAEALEAYRTTRELLIDELGLEPGEDLRRLETAILAGDPTLAMGADHAPQQQPRPSAPPPAEMVVPLQLPADIGEFTGRAGLVAQARELLAQGGLATRVVALVGKPGIGKSAVAVHVAHLLVEDHFPDGQLYCDLGGTREHPAGAADVLGRFLRAMGIPGTSIPDAEDERAEMYRQLVARKRMLVVLDDAASERQVRALLPGSSSCSVIVTSRTRLTGLPGVRVLEVDVLGHDEALEMLSTVIGRDRVDAEPAAATALIRLVGSLPLALRIVAARLAARPGWSLAWMLERLSDERRRLDELAHGEMMVRASLALTYDGLPGEARRLLRLLGALDGLSFPTWVAAALLDVDVFHAADLLEGLVDAQMLEVVAFDATGSPRYKFHDLIRLFAREQLELNEGDESRLVALRRVVGGWLALAGEAHTRVYGGDFTSLHGDAPRWLPSKSHVDRLLADPLLWLETEHAHLCAAVEVSAAEGLHEAAWDLAVTLVTLFEARCYFADWERTHQQALAAVRAAGNTRGEAALLCSMASLQLSWSRARAARELVEPALRTFEALGDERGVALARRNLALVHHRLGDLENAAPLYLAALGGFRASGDPVGQAWVLTQIAQIDLEHGEQERAADRLYEALDICRRFGNQRVEVQVRYRLSDLMVRQGRHWEAEESLGELLSAVRASGDTVGEARVLHKLAVVKLALEDPEAAEGLLREALEVRERAMDHGGAAETRAELAVVLAERGDRAAAVSLLGRAISTFAERNMGAARLRAQQVLERIRAG